MPKIIVLEGLDCSFKETNSKKLLQYLSLRGYKTALFSFPNYVSNSSYFIREYLLGRYSYDPSELKPELVSLFYSLDRYDTFKKEIEPVMKDLDFIILDRYIGSNAVYQCANIENYADKIEYIHNLYNLEYNIMGLPREDLVLFLEVPYSVSVELMRKKNIDDINEKCSEFQKKVYKSAREICDLKGWSKVNCTKDGKVLSKEEIFENIKEKIQFLLEE